MTAVGGIPTAPVEYGRCACCGNFGWGPWVEDLTVGIALVQHCQSPQSNAPQDDGDRVTMVGPHHQQEEDA